MFAPSPPPSFSESQQESPDMFAPSPPHEQDQQNVPPVVSEFNQYEHDDSVNILDQNPLWMRGGGAKQNWKFPAFFLEPSPPLFGQKECI